VTSAITAATAKAPPVVASATAPAVAPLRKHIRIVTARTPKKNEASDARRIASNWY